MGSRRNDIDWLRTLASYLVVVYHTAQFFDFQMKTYYKDAERSAVLDCFTRFVHLWHMPLFFLLAGWSANSSLKVRGARRFLLERALRLLVPLVFGTAVLCAPPRWVEFRTGLWKTSSGEQTPTPQSISFIAFLQEYYYREGISWGHLWFLAYLFTFSVIYLPVLWVLSKLSFTELDIKNTAWMLTNAPVVVLALVQLRLRDRWPGYQNLVDDWANFWFYSTFFMSGFCLARYRGLDDYLQLSCKRNGVLGFLACSGYMFRHQLSKVNSKPDAGQHILSALGSWYIVCFFLPFARQILSDSPVPAFWSDSAFPVYITHDIPLCLVADFILGQWEASVVKKFIFSTIVSLLSSVLFNSVVVMRVPFLKFLLGIKSPKPTSPFKRVTTLADMKSLAGHLTGVTTVDRLEKLASEREGE